MKKALPILSLLVFILSSCSSSDGSEDEALQGPLISKMVYQGESITWDYRNHEFNFIYDDNARLTRINREDKVYREFTYSNDLITEVKDYVFWNGGNEPELEDIFHFDYDSANRLVKATTNSFEYIFTYTDDSHADYIIHIYSWSGNNNLYRTGTINFDSVTKNILSVTSTNYENYLNLNGSPEPIYPTHKQDLAYDYKKHPCANVKGFKELAFFNLMSMSMSMSMAVFTPHFGVSNNLTAVSTYPIDTPNNNAYSIWSYEYGDTFPSKSKKMSNDDFNVIFYF